MKRDKLYTVNKWNQPLFADVDRRGRNIFDGLNGSLMQRGVPIASGYNPQFKAPDTIDLNSIIQKNAYNDYLNSSGNNWFGISKKNNPLSRVNIGTTAKAAGGAAAAMGSQIGVSENNKRGMYDVLDPIHQAAGGKESAVGNAFGDAGVGLFQIGATSGNPWLMAAGAAAKIVGGSINALAGIKENKENIATINSSIDTKNNLGNIANTASSNEELMSLADYLSAGTGFDYDDLYKGGILSKGKAKRKGMKLINRENSALALQNYNYGTAVDKVDRMNDELALANSHAYGGPLGFGTGALGLMQQNRYFDTINNRSNAIAKNQVLGTNPSTNIFDDGGGLESAFLDSFNSDPIGAAVRYNRGIEQMEAQKEAEEAAAAREAEYLSMQQRLANLETQNQGLQALIAAQPTIPVIEDTTPEPAEESSESLAASEAPKMSGKAEDNWKYIESELKKSGKFNDVQIKGIKYNLQRESGIGTFDGGDSGTALGLAQWKGSRKPKDMSLAGQTRHLIETLGNYDGREHWIGRDNYMGFMNARTPEEAHYYIAKGYERPAANILSKVKNVSDMSLRRQRAFGGELGTNSTDWSNGLLYIDAGDTHENNPFGGVPLGVDAEGIPNLVEEGETVYNDYVFSDRMTVPDFMYKELGLGGTVRKKGKPMSFADASKKLAQESEQRPNDLISRDTLKSLLSKLAEVQETERMRNQAEEYLGLEHACGGKIHKYEKGGDKSSNHDFGDGTKNPEFTFKFFDTDLPTLREEASPELPIGGERNGSRLFDIDQWGNPIPVATTPPASTPSVTDSVQRQRNNWWNRIWKSDVNGIYPTWMRYAPAFGSGVMAMTDLLGLTNRPDYTYANKLEAAASQAGFAPNVTYSPIGNYLRYRPEDIWYEQNRLDANARATDRAIRNSGANQGATAAAILANGYNSQIADGELYRKALEYNDAQRERVADFNRRTDMFNSQMGLEASMANARYNQQARQMGLSGLAQAAAMRDSIDQRIGAARAANLTNFLTSLGNIGRENFALNQINSDKSRRHGARANGTSYDKKTGRALGGKIKKQK